MITKEADDDLSKARNGGQKVDSLSTLQKKVTVEVQWVKSRVDSCLKHPTKLNILTL